MPNIAIKSLACLAVLPLLAVGGGVFAGVTIRHSCPEDPEDIASFTQRDAGGQLAAAPNDAPEQRLAAVSPEPKPNVQPQAPLRATHPCGEDRPGVEHRPFASEPRS